MCSLLISRIPSQVSWSCSPLIVLLPWTEWELRSIKVNIVQVDEIKLPEIAAIFYTVNSVFQRTLFSMETGSITLSKLLPNMVGWQCRMPKQTKTYATSNLVSLQFRSFRSSSNNNKLWLIESCEQRVVQTSTWTFDASWSLHQDNLYIYSFILKSTNLFLLSFRTRQRAPPLLQTRDGGVVFSILLWPHPRYKRESVGMYLLLLRRDSNKKERKGRGDEDNGQRSSRCRRISSPGMLFLSF